MKVATEPIFLLAQRNSDLKLSSTLQASSLHHEVGLPIQIFSYSLSSSPRCYNQIQSLAQRCNVVLTWSLAVCVCRAVLCSWRKTFCFCSVRIWLLKETFCVSKCFSCSLSNCFSVCRAAFWKRHCIEGVTEEMKQLSWSFGALSKRRAN